MVSERQKNSKISQRWLIENGKKGDGGRVERKIAVNNDKFKNVQVTLFITGTTERSASPLSASK